MTTKQTLRKKTTAKKTKKQTKKLVLLDAHAILHRAYHALPDFTSPTGEPTGALYGVVAMLLNIVGELKPDYIAACFDLPEPTYRHEAFKDYKAGRSKTDDALVQQIIRSRDIFAAFGIPIYEHAGFEADDALGTIAHQMKGEKDLQVIIASGDMDTMQLIEKKRVVVYTLKKGIKDTITYDEAGVKERFGFGPTLIPDYKGLRGDPSDNIPGIPGIGEKTATQLITNFGSLEKMYKTLEQKNGPEKFETAGIKKRIIGLLQDHKEDAEFSKMLATIRLDMPITYEIPEVTWREKLDIETILELFAELGFRTLGARLRTMFDVMAVETPDSVTAPAAFDPVRTEAAALALWLLQSDTTNPTYEDIIDYGRSYASTTDFDEIEKHLQVELKKADLLELYEETEKPLLEVITVMQKNGVALDVPFFKKLSTTIHTELTALEKTIYGHAGSEFNINSPKQLGEVLFDTLDLKPKNAKKTAGGQRSTKESELEKLRDEHEIIPAILRYRELAKLASTYVDNLPEMVDEKTKRLHATFQPMGTVTGRFSSKDPNLQNIPIRTEEGRMIRKGFVASPGCTWVSIDYSQIELRLAAVLSGDEKLKEIFTRGVDVHRAVAAQVFGLDEGEVTSEQRRYAKTINFGILYGMGVNALRGNLGENTTREEAQQFLNAYFNTYTRLAEYLEETKAAAREHGYTTTMFNRRRHFPGITATAPFIRAAAERMAINAPIQGSQADIIRIAMVRIHEYLTTEKLLDDVRMMIQVHDELDFEIKNKRIETVVPKLKSIMEEVLTMAETDGVPIIADVQTGENWYDLEDWKE